MCVHVVVVVIVNYFSFLSLAASELHWEFNTNKFSIHNTTCLHLAVDISLVPISAYRQLWRMDMGYPYFSQFCNPAVVES